MNNLKHFLQLTIIGLSLGTIIFNQDAQGGTAQSIKKSMHKKAHVVKKKTFSNYPKNIKPKETIYRWQKWNSFQIDLTEVYTHNQNIMGTYKLVSSNVQLARSKQHGTIFSQALKGQLGHMLIKRGKFYLFRPMAGHDALDNFTEVESVDFPISIYRNGKNRFLSARLDKNDEHYFFKLKNYVPIFSATTGREPSNQPAAVLKENYDSEVKFSCSKHKPNAYTCTASIIFTKKYTDMVSVSTPPQEIVTKRIRGEKI